jgi:electron-transferring-flavoprotein dehydrogenase
VRWLARRAEALGVEIYPGFPAASLLLGPDGAVAGVRTADVGIAKDGSRKPSYDPGTVLRADVTLLAEGCRGSLSQRAMQLFDLRGAACPQTYALGVKEVWEVDPGKHSPGEVWHTVGWPLPWDTYGGGWLYHMGSNRVSLG